MKLYTDAFNKPIVKEDVTAAVNVMIVTKRIDTFLLSRRLQWGYAKAAAIIRLLEDADVISLYYQGKRNILLKDFNQANNAALRQLKKGNQ